MTPAMRRRVAAPTGNRISRLLAVVTGIVVLILSGSSPIEASSSPQSVEAFTVRLEQRIGELMDAYDIPGVAVALVREGDPVWSAAYGYADVEARRPMTVDTANRAESISKAVTAWGVMKLVEQGEIGLDDPVTRHIKNWEFPGTAYSEEKITVRQLLSHTAGVSLGTIGREFSPIGPVPSLEQDLAQEFSMVSQPGPQFLYSNTGFNLLELLIEQVTGEDFAEYMEREVLEPLGMQRSSFTWSEDLTPFPTGYDLDGTPVPPYVYPEKASGGLFATVEDIARFAAAGMAGSYYTDRGVLGLNSIEQLYTPTIEISGIFRFVSDSYGLGHFTETLDNGDRAVWHGGQGHGWMTHLHSIPETGDGIVILTNSQRSWPMISQILGDWAEWTNLPPVGMTIITRATTIVWIIISVTAVAALWQLWRLGRGLVSGRRHLGPLSSHGRWLRLGQATLSVILLSILGLGLAQELWSFYVTPVFPKASSWLAVSTLALAFVLLLSALTPRTAADGPGTPQGEGRSGRGLTIAPN